MAAPDPVTPAAGEPDERFVSALALYDVLARRNARNPLFLKRTLSYRVAMRRTKARELGRAMRASCGAVPTKEVAVTVHAITDDEAVTKNPRKPHLLCFALAADVLAGKRVRVRCAKRVWPESASVDAHLQPSTCTIPVGDDDGASTPGVGVLAWLDGPAAPTILGTCTRGAAPLAILTPQGGPPCDASTAEHLPRAFGVVPDGATVLWAHVSPSPSASAKDVTLLPHALHVHVPSDNAADATMDTDGPELWPTFELRPLSGPGVIASVRTALKADQQPAVVAKVPHRIGTLLAWWSTERCLRPARLCPFPTRPPNVSLMTRAERMQTARLANAGTSDATPHATHGGMTPGTCQLIESVAPRRVMFNYIINNRNPQDNIVRRTELVSNYYCPFCLCACGHFRGLQLHLLTSHDRFSYAFSAELKHQSANAVFEHDREAAARRREANAAGAANLAGAATAAASKASAEPLVPPSLLPKEPTVTVTVRKPLRGADAAVAEELLGDPITREFALVMHRGPKALEAAQRDAAVRRYEATAAAVRSAEELAHELAPAAKVRRKGERGGMVAPPPIAGATAQGLAYLHEVRATTAGPSGRKGRPVRFSGTAAAAASDNLVSKRTYFYSQTKLPIHPEDFTADLVTAAPDSDDDDGFASESEFVEETEKKLAAYNDMRDDDRRFMVLWNLQCRRRRVLVDVQCPVACEAFAMDRAAELRASPGLLRAFLMHLLTLQEHGLVDGPCIDACLLLLERSDAGAASAK